MAKLLFDGKLLLRPITVSRKRLFTGRKRFLKQRYLKSKGLEREPSVLKGNAGRILTSRKSKSLRVQRLLAEIEARSEIMTDDQAYVPTGLLERFMGFVRDKLWVGPSAYQSKIMRDVIGHLVKQGESSDA